MSNDNDSISASAIGIVVGVLLMMFASLFWIIPTYKVWNAGKQGEAILRQAESTKLVMIEQAKAELEASKLRAQAIETVGAMAQKYPEYRQQEFIAAFGEALNSGQVEQIIYVPTEANIPIVETRK
jgi:hypothetical protein